MKRTKMQKGITLIALIITIVVLLIIAVVTIGNIQNTKIIEYAQNAATDYNNKKDEEEDILAGYESIIKEHLPGGDKVTYKGDVPIPTGFYYVTGTKDTGFVISDNSADENNASGKSGNQFVWIPVAENEFSTFAVLQDGSTENYRGALYNWDNNRTYSWSSTSTYYREPANLTGTKTWDVATTVNGNPVETGTTYNYDGTDMFNLFDMGTYSENYYQDKFNKMVKSVAKYGGFYVGRYETSLDADKTKAQSKSGQLVMNNIEWYRMYRYSETYSQSGVISEMIWGCQWDAMMRFIGSRATETGNVSHNFSEPYKTGGTDYTKNDYNDISNNIYDLEGNVVESTQEANNTDSRVFRGGYCYSSGSPSSREDGSPTNTDSDVGSRLALYVEL